MQLLERIENDFKQALKEKDKLTVSILRMVKSAIHNKEIEKKSAALTEAEVAKVLTRQVQQHRDSIELFKKGNRPELVEKETKELEILKRYLPKQLSPQEITSVIETIIIQEGAKGKSDFPQVMKLAMSQLQGKADGKLVSQIVSEKLTPEKT